MSKMFSPSRPIGSKKFIKKRLYDTFEWKSYSQRFLKVNPKCYSCGKPSQVCDHIIPFKNNVELFENNTNHLPLCTKCHNTITSNFDRYSPPLTEKKLQWISDMRVSNIITIPVKVIPYREK